MADNAKPTKEVKPGIKSTEFWMTVGLLAVGVGMLIWGAVSGKDSLVQTGIGLMGAAGVAYPVARGLAK